MAFRGKAPPHPPLAGRVSLRLKADVLIKLQECLGGAADEGPGAETSGAVRQPLCQFQGEASQCISSQSRCSPRLTPKTPPSTFTPPPHITGEEEGEEPLSLPPNLFFRRAATC